MPTLTLTDLAPGRTATRQDTEGRITGIKPEGDYKTFAYLSGKLHQIDHVMPTRTIRWSTSPTTCSVYRAVGCSRIATTSTSKDRWKRCVEACNRYPKEARQQSRDRGVGRMWCSVISPPVAKGVIVKVKDTQSFIEVARAIHGDRYDYSETQYLGAQEEIWIICKTHGKFRLAEAGSHYRSGKRPCGCRRCGDDSRMVSHQCECGKVVGRDDWNYVRKCCVPCSRTIRSEEERTSQCHNCGKPCYNRGYKVVHCSNTCKLQTDKKKSVLVTEPCVVCGTLVTKKRYLANPVKSTCCSNACQKQWSIVANRGPGQTANIDWVARSKKAKAKYYKKASRERFAKSEYKKWLRIASKYLVNNEQTPWERRCTSASNLLSHRMNPSSRRKAFSENTDWQKSTREAIKKINAKSKRSMKCKWTKKATAISGTLRRRRDLLNAKKLTWQPIAG